MDFRIASLSVMTDALVVQGRALGAGRLPRGSRQVSFSAASASYHPAGPVRGLGLGELHGPLHESWGARERQNMRPYELGPTLRHDRCRRERPPGKVLSP